MGDYLPHTLDESVSESFPDYSIIPQYDGNISLLSCDSNASVCSDSDLTGQPIETLVSRDFRQEVFPPPVWYEEYTSRRGEDILSVRQTVRRNSKLLQCMSLPIIAVSNIRSLLPKINSFKTDVLEREIGLSLLSEIWEVKGEKNM